LPVDDRIVRLITEVLIGSPVARTLGVELAAVEAGRVRLRLPFRHDNITVGDIVHGGVIATLIDIAGAAAAAAGADPDAPGGGATSTLAISYLAPANGVDLMADAVVLQRGRTQAVSEVTVRDAAGRAVAKALVTSRVFAATGRGAGRD
jgi:uncharacterized protein (TIGR00369 family)